MHHKDFHTLKETFAQGDIFGLEAFEEIVSGKSQIHYDNSVMDLYWRLENQRKLRFFRSVSVLIHGNKSPSLLLCFLGSRWSGRCIVAQSKDNNGRRC